MFFFWLFGASILVSLNLVPLIMLSQYRGELVEADFSKGRYPCPKHMKIGVHPKMLKALWNKFKAILPNNAKLDCTLSWHLENEARKAIVWRVAQTSDGSRFWLKKKCTNAAGPLDVMDTIVDNMTATYRKIAEKAAQDGYSWFGLGGACFDKLHAWEKDRPGKEGQYMLLMGSRRPEGFKKQ